MTTQHDASRLAGDRGAATMWMTFGVVIVLSVCGLTFDGGMLISAKRQAINNAEEAARAGAQALDPAAVYGTGPRTLDPAAAVARAEAFIAANGWTGYATATPTGVTVTIERTQTMTFLTMFGVADKTVAGTATARPYQGLAGP